MLLAVIFSQNEACSPEFALFSQKRAIEEDQQTSDPADLLIKKPDISHLSSFLSNVILMLLIRNVY
jgi:hypothetical protein